MGPIAFKKFSFVSTDGLNIACSRWSNRSPPRGIIQIAHGLGEHMGRYGELISSLVHAGLVVYGNDHRGHGETATSPENLGDLGPGGFALLVEDMARLLQIAKSEYPEQPVILLGHGLGSFAAQKYLLDNSTEIEGLALSGSGALDEFARLARAAKPGENILNAGFLPARTPYDWLSRDPAVAESVSRDPLCFPELRPASMESLLAAARELANPNRLRHVRPDLPIYVFSGDADPVGQKSVGVGVLMERYREAGIQHLACRIYAGARHAVFNEINRTEVMADLLIWISTTLEW